LPTDRFQIVVDDLFRGGEFFLSDSQRRRYEEQQRHYEQSSSGEHRIEVYFFFVAALRAANFFALTPFVELPVFFAAFVDFPALLVALTVGCNPSPASSGGVPGISLAPDFAFFPASAFWFSVYSNSFNCPPRTLYLSTFLVVSFGISSLLFVRSVPLDTANTAFV